MLLCVLSIKKNKNNDVKEPLNHKGFLVFYRTLDNYAQSLSKHSAPTNIG